MHPISDCFVRPSQRKAGWCFSVYQKVSACSRRGFHFGSPPLTLAKAVPKLSYLHYASGVLRFHTLEDFRGFWGERDSYFLDYHACHPWSRVAYVKRSVSIIVVSMQTMYGGFSATGGYNKNT